MSRTIENRVVEMQFQNEQFESAVAQSRQSIQLLEKDLKLLDGVKALKNLDETISSIDTSHISSALETLENRFSTLGVVGMSVINNVTNTIYGKLINAISTATSSITGLFNTIYQRGLTRATNIQKADFSLQGLLSTQYDDWKEIEEKKKAIAAVIDKSVSGTSYGYDQAATVASTLAASYGTGAEDIERIGETLNTIVGVAAQTGTEFTSVANVFTKIAASGKAMNMELNSIQNWGIGATSMIADYINQNKNLQKQINKTISTAKKRRKEYQQITEADVYEAASRGAISSQIIMDVFGVFFENAQKANETLSGITSNIYAALGRLGAAFLTPVIENYGPLVNFLKEVRLKIVDVLNVLNQYKIPTYVTNLIKDILDAGRFVLSEFDLPSYLRDSAKYLSDFFNILQKAFSVYDDWLSSDYSITKMLFGWDGSKDFDWTNADSQYRIFLDMMDTWKENRNFIDKSLDSFALDVLRDKGIKGEHQIKIYRDMMKDLSENTIIQGIRVGDVWDEARKRRDEYYNSYREEEESAKEDALRRSKEIYDKYTNLSDIMSFNYFNKIVEGFSNIANAIGYVKNTFISAFELFDPDGKRTSIIRLLLGDTEEATAYKYREVINNIAESFYNLTDKIKKFIESENAKDIITFVANVFDTAFDIIGAIFKILKNAIKSFSPLISKIVTFISAILNSINGMKETSQEMNVMETIVDAISFVVDKLAKALEFAWDALMLFIDGLSSGNGIKILLTFYEVAKKIANYIYEHWPEFIEKVTPYLESFNEGIKNAAIFLKDKLEVAFETIQPYLDEFLNWLGIATDDTEEATKPIEDINNTLDTTSEVVNGVNNAIQTIDGTVKSIRGSGSHILGAFGAKIVDFSDTLHDFIPLGEKFGAAINSINNSDIDISDGEGEKLTFLQKILIAIVGLYKKVTTYIKNFPDWISKKTNGFNFIDYLKEKFDKIKDWAKNIDVDRVLDIVSRILSIFTGNWIGVNIGSAIGNTSKALLKVPDMINSVSTTIRYFTPFYADVMKADNETTRREAIADIIKSIAGVLISLAIAFGVVAYGVYKLGQMDPDKLNQGLRAMWMIFTPIIAIIAGVLVFAGIFAGKNTNSTIANQLPLIGSIKGLKNALALIKNGGFIKQTKEVKSQGKDVWKPIAALAVVIVAFAAAVSIITSAIAKVGALRPEEIDRGMYVFWRVVAVVVGLMVLVGLFAFILSSFQSGSAKSTDSINKITQNGKGAGVAKQIKGTAKQSAFAKGGADWKVIAALAAAILIIGISIKSIMSSIALISVIPMSHLDNALLVFQKVVLAIVALLVIVGVIAVAMTAFNSKSTSTKSIAGPLVALAAILLILGFVITGILETLALIANIPMEHMDVALNALKAVIGGLASLLIVLGVIMIAVSAFTAFSKDPNAVSKSLLSTAAILAAAALLFFAIGSSVLLIAEAFGIIALALTQVNPDMYDTLETILGVILGAIVLIIAGIDVLAGLMKGSGSSWDIVAGIALIAVVIAAMSLLMFCLGEMLKAFGESGINSNAIIGILITIFSAIIILVVIGAVIGGLATSQVYILAGIAVIAAMLVTVAILAFALGTLALNIGKGAKFLAQAIEKFIDIFENLDGKRSKKIAENVGTLMYNLAEAFITGFIDFVGLIERNQLRIRFALMVLFSMIGQVLLTVALSTFKTFLDGAEAVLTMLEEWLNKNLFKITSLLDLIAAIVYVFLSGQDGRGGFIGNLISIIGNALYVLWYGGNDWVGVLNFIAQGITDLIKLIKEEGPKIADTLGWLIDDIFSRMRNAIINPEQLEKFKATIDDFIDMIIGQILKDLGFVDENGKDKSETKGSEIMNTFIASMFIPAVWNITKIDWSAVTKWISDVCGKIREGFLTVIHAEIPLGTMIISALNDDLDEMAKGGNKVAETLLHVTRNVLGIKSPSKEFYKIGKFCIQGLVNSFKDGGALVTKEAQKTGDLVMDPVEHLKSRLKLIFSSLTNDLASSLGIDSFTITPTMDLTQITEGFGSIQDMMNGNSSFDISALSGSMTDSLSASDTASGFDETNAPDSGFLNGLDTETIVNFTQNNYSPESLSRIDIYRDTKNILSNPSAISQIVTALK